MLNVEEIEHGILRANHRRVLPRCPAFRPGDPRRALALPEVDPACTSP